MIVCHIAAVWRSNLLSTSEAASELPAADVLMAVPIEKAVPSYATG